ncbi:MAG: hypothetical protein AAFR54_17225, partial [Planctomycetota bacterium]
MAKNKKDRAARKGTGRPADRSEALASFLTRDLTRLARDGALVPGVGLGPRVAELVRLLEAGRSPLVVG